MMQTTAAVQQNNSKDGETVQVHGAPIHPAWVDVQEIWNGTKAAAANSSWVQGGVACVAWGVGIVAVALATSNNKIS